MSVEIILTVTMRCDTPGCTAWEEHTQPVESILKVDCEVAFPGWVRRPTVRPRALDPPESDYCPHCAAAIERAEGGENP